MSQEQLQDVETRMTTPRTVWYYSMWLDAEKRRVYFKALFAKPVNYFEAQRIAEVGHKWPACMSTKNVAEFEREVNF